MKKLLAIIAVLGLLTGCSCKANITEETPTKAVERFLNNYQTLNSDVVTQLNSVVSAETTFTEEQKEKYKDLMKKHYQALKYDIKDEVVNGNNATVTVEIEVKDYSKVITEMEEYQKTQPDEFNNEEGVYDVTLYNDYRLEKLKSTTDTVTYTLNLTLTKEDDKWQLDDISDTDESKIHGTYKY